jgi:rare lipoprotein A (peptidoglycan hydrolase)
MRNFISKENSYSITRLHNRNQSILLILWTLIISFLLFFSISGYCEDVWNGNAATIRGGELESNELVAASNSFPLNSKVMVTNQQNGRSIAVYIQKRIPDSSNMFLLLSDAASKALGIGEYDVINVEARVLSYGVDEIIGLPDDLPYNPDPDFWRGTQAPKPQATLSPEELFTPSPMPMEYATPEPTAEPCGEETPVPTPCAVPTETPPCGAVTAETTPEPTAEAAATPESTPEVIGRNPEKNLYMLPHEDKSFMALDYKKPDAKEEDISKNLKLDEANAKIERPTEGGIAYQNKIREQEMSETDMKEPGYERSQIIDVAPFNVSEEEFEYLADLPPVQKKPSLVPEVSEEGIKVPETVIGLEPTEPLSPLVRMGAPEPSTEYGKVSEPEIALVPSEPNTPTKTTSKPEASTEYGKVKESEVALFPEEPEVAIKTKGGAVPTEEYPRITEKENEMTAGEPTVHEKKKTSGTKDNGIEPTDGKTTIIRESEITLIPTTPNPPPEEIIHEQKKNVTTAVEETSVLAKNSYFIQIGSYTDKATAQKMTDRYKGTYPTFMYTPAGSTLKIYKVLIGPLNKPESDTLYFRFRSNGIKDVFIKYNQ